MAGILRGQDTFAVLFVIGAGFGLLVGAARAAARQGRPAFAAGLIPLAPDRDLSEFYAAHAGKIFHRHYVRPRTDLDQEARVTWERAVGAANRIYRSESLRDEAVDAERVAADVPELLWKIIEGLVDMTEGLKIDVEANAISDCTTDSSEAVQLSLLSAAQSSTTVCSCRAESGGTWSRSH